MSSTDPQTLDSDAPRPDETTSASGALALLKALRRTLAPGDNAGSARLRRGRAVGLVPAAGTPHTARSQLYVASGPPRFLFTTNEARSDAGAFRQTQVALLKSRLVLNAALPPGQGSRVADRAGARRARGLARKGAEGGQRRQSGNPQRRPQRRPAGALKVLVDAVVTAYMQEIVNKEQIKRQALDHLKTIAGQYDGNCASSGKAVQAGRERRLLRQAGHQARHEAALQCRAVFT